MSEDFEESDVKPEPFSPDENDDIMKILIASDIHLGFEQTTSRGEDDDSFRTFEEILEHARDEEVDMILLAGNLFHESNPPYKVITKCVELLREYCLGTHRRVEISSLGNTSNEVFGHCNKKTINYEDPNLKIEIPIFSIHGNHDDPSFSAIGSMDLLGATGLINYFGKWSDTTQINIAPLYLEKGSTAVALYGLSNMNDQQLSTLMKDNKLKFSRTDEILVDFNIFVLNQNRAENSPKSFVPDDLLPDFLDLVVWGHERECRILPEKSKSKAFYISQPGSTVATSLSKKETEAKKVGILYIHKNTVTMKTDYKMRTIDLKTVRPFVFEDLVLNEHQHEIISQNNRSEGVEKFLDRYLSDILIPKAAQQLTEHPDQPEKPLIRVRIFYSDDRDLIDTSRLSQKYRGLVANPNDMILFRKCSADFKRIDIPSEEKDFGQVGEIFRFDDSKKDWRQTVQGGLTEYFNEDDKINKLSVLSLPSFNNALSEFVNSNNRNAFHDLVMTQMDDAVNHLMTCNHKEKNEVLEALKELRNSRS